ncbi:hypothetical protein [Lederbergia galactosidilytica]|uniref:Uncharacterized protein n=1 Tax=Lederbergia galactosidilytica TaxID=217031 RepID=A0A177ZS96_9BACI|nr:hypothetical protein [Lederbergia galactosidilytica]OAK70654.1 hypothetical protein ABB05_11750 [Lederbergia galactosidilytica]
MLFVMVTILIFSIPFIWVVWTLMDVKSGKRKKIVWKSPVILLIILVFGSIFIHIYLFKMYGFPIFLTKLVYLASKKCMKWHLKMHATCRLQLLLY